MAALKADFVEVFRDPLDFDEPDREFDPLFEFADKELRRRYLEREERLVRTIAMDHEGEEDALAIADNQWRFYEREQYLRSLDSLWKAHLVQMDHLKAKVDRGVDWICTQLFFDNRAYFDWLERCDLAGIQTPTIAGIMPITSLASMKKMAELAGGANFPAPLLRRLHRFQDDPNAVRQAGVSWAAEQCADLLDHGVRGIHFYTMNQSFATEEIYRTLGAPKGSMLRGSH